MNVSLNEIKLFGSHNHLTAGVWNSSYEKTLILHRNFDLMLMRLIMWLIFM